MLFLPLLSHSIVRFSVVSFILTLQTSPTVCMLWYPRTSVSYTSVYPTSPCTCHSLILPTLLFISPIFPPLFPYYVHAEGFPPITVPVCVCVWIGCSPVKIPFYSCVQNMFVQSIIHNCIIRKSIMTDHHRCAISKCGLMD